MTADVNQSRAKLATRLAFVAAGFGVACWAPLVPFAKTRCHLGDGTMGLVLLLLGAGSIVAMPLAANLSGRFSSKPIVLTGGLGLAVTLPLLSIVSSPIALGVALFAFGAFLGSLDVAMNLHAVDVEHASEKPLMSGFHALFSIGGFLGSGTVTALLSRGIAPSSSTLLSSAILVALILVALPRMLSNREGTKQPLFAIPKGIVLVIAIFAAISFLVEGALLDWSALLLVGEHLVSAAHGGLGYMLFSIAMTFSRFVGDGIVARFGNRIVLTLGGVTALLGLCGLLLAPVAWIGLVSFVFVGLGAANIVPILFRLAGTQHTMPKGLAVAALTTAGYAGMLTGPAVIGFLSKGIGLHNAFWFLAALLACVPIFCKYVTVEDPH
ncbi:major facilitator superfamily MFS_1 [Granulicella mallensis MP5ACTX8]|uniref:Major facilitator superfamily MFS_1 n=1 Tax=Granulicella mallensis (strain ATCC BAA-1857 / DSM 23137 / MP5ACTX8) TaxID=682795 RepID=G8NNP9_GRAMM|nr:major facilitator superfamily MFS_1 [Granulicella mallensis MP5ACTX8]